MSKCFGKNKKGDKNKAERKFETYQPTALIKREPIPNSQVTQQITQTIVKNSVTVSTNKSTYFSNRSISSSSNGSNPVQNVISTDALPFISSSPTRSSFKFSPARSAFFSEPLTTRPNNLNYQSPYPSRWNSFDKTNPSYITNAQVPQRHLGVDYDTDVLRQKLKIKVFKNGKFYDNEPNKKVPVYSTHSKFRGRLLLINNIKFVDGKQMRVGAELDEINLKQLFDQLGFMITNHRDLNKKDMENKIIAFRNDNRLKRVDIGAVIIMSHGTGGERSDSTEVACADGQRIETHWIIDQFNSEQCPNLRGKPKIFIFQCCRGDRTDIMYDAIPFVVPLSSRITSDMLIAYSTIPGFVSHRDPKNGTWYIQAICRIFMDHAYDTDVESLLKMVDHSLSQLASEINSRQTSSFENRGFKTCFLHP